MIRLTRHARDCLKKRRLPRAWVDSTIETPDLTAPDPDDPALTRSYKTIAEAAGKVLRVVHRPDGDDILIITVHFDRGAKP